MDKSKENAFGWLPGAMPVVAGLIADRRRTEGSAHVNLCWRKGVIERLPGWFFAREGSLAVGTPWGNLTNVEAWLITPTQGLLAMPAPNETPDALSAANGKT